MRTALSEKMEFIHLENLHKDINGKRFFSVYIRPGKKCST